MDEEEEQFYGFPEGDPVRVSIQSKVGRLKTVVDQLEIQQMKEESHCQTTACSSEKELPFRHPPKRPPNRFLRRSESIPLAAPVKVKEDDSKKCQSVSSSPYSRTVQALVVQEKSYSIPEELTNNLDMNGSKPVLLLKEKLLPMPHLYKHAPVKLPKPPALKRIDVQLSDLESTMPLLSPNEPTQHVNSKLARLTRRPNKFLMVKSSNSVDKVIMANGDVADDENIKLKSTNSIRSMSPVSSNSSDATAHEKLLPALEVSNAIPSKPIAMNKKENPLPPSEAQIPEELAETLDIRDLEVRKPIMIDKEKVESNQVIKQQSTTIPKARASKPLSPAKRTSTPELNFLNGQTSLRSKRTIVPNKRFFSNDDSPSSVPKQEDKIPISRRVVEKPEPSDSRVSDKIQEERSEQDRFKGKRKRNFSDDTNGFSGQKYASALNDVKVTKKRADSVDTAKQKRKRSIENNEVSVPDTPPPTSIPVVDAPGSSELSARPRRTIKIPKFHDETESLKEIVSKKVEVSEPKMKRRKSEKIAQNHVQPTADEVLVTQESVAKPLSDDSGASAVVSLDSSRNLSLVTEAVRAVEATSSADGKSSINKVNGVKGESKPKAHEVDEVPLDEAEVAFYRANSAFRGACVLKINNENYETEVICCGICGQVKKYRTSAEKRKRGSFLCSDCGDVVNKIFTTAMKAKPFSCIVGPPICEGACPVVFSPPDQFCEACFAKTCLKNLPMKDDIYFKIWRAIPPLSRGCVSTTPVANPTTPNIGKIVQVNDTGVIVKISSSLKILSQRKPILNGIDVISDDSNSVDNITSNVDLISARITTFPHRIDSSASSTNCENTVPKNSIDESHSVENSNNVKAAGVSKEEMLLGRQIGQERVKAIIDPILKPDIADIEIFGFPVVVCGTAYPRKPLCFLCGSSGIEQLIFCSHCCEPFHPFCAGDDLLLDTYISRYNCHENQTLSRKSFEEDIESCESTETIQNTLVTVPKENANVDDSKVVVKWTCRRCQDCKCCGVSIGREELIRCSRCRNPYHLQTCIDKRFLSKIKDLDKLKKLWTCDTCLKCKSCGKKIESSRKILSITVADEDVDDLDSGISNNLMLCIDCFKQRKKGSFCPFCDGSYDDNDWDSKMMECCKCNRWIHATCEMLSDEEYHILGTIPEYIEYICRLCEPVDNPLWYNSIQSQITKECNSVIRLFEKKALGTFRKKRSSIDLKPRYVCNLFGEIPTCDDDADSSWSTLVPSDDEHDDDYRKEILEALPEDSDFRNTPKFEQISEEADLRKTPPLQLVAEGEGLTCTPRLRKNIRKKVSGEEILKCKVYLRDFVKFPQTLKENWYALKVLGVEILNKFQDVEEVRTTHKTPIHKTPVKCFTPTKHVSGVCDSIRNASSSIKSLRIFQNLVYRAIKSSGEGDDGVEIMINQAKEAMQEVFPWFEQDWNLTDEAKEKTSSDVNLVGIQGDVISDNHDSIAANPFKEVFWNSLDFFDNRVCVLCGEVGDFPPDSCGRLLWAGVNEWIHCNCALWSSEVYEDESGALKQIGNALHRGKSLRCTVCGLKGATVSCCKSGCRKSFHFLCAREANCSLFQDQRMFCAHHELSEKQQDQIQHDMKIGRKVFVDLDWLQRREQKVCTDEIKVFVGSLRVDSIGRIFPISVTNKTWEDSMKTFLVPSNFKAQRVFWSSVDPCQKQCYVFETDISSDGFGDKVQDVGINIVVDHQKHEESVQRGLQNINKFHQWLVNAPKYHDEHLIDWLPRCSKVFSMEYDEFDVFNSKRKTSCSPVSLSSFGSFNKLTPTSRFQDSNFRKIETEGIDRDNEAMSTEGYSSSIDDYVNKNAKRVTERVKKRRRSSCKMGTKRQRYQLNMKDTLSPRRRSMRNRQLLEEVSQDNYSRIGKQLDSDDDSGVMEGSSATGSCEGDMPRCRVNLLSQFNDSADLETLNNDSISESLCMDRLYQSPIDPSLEDFQLYSCTTKADNEVYRAAIKFEVKGNEAVSCFHSCDAMATWMYVFERVSKSRLAHKLTPLTQPTLGTSACGNRLELANSFRMLGITHRSVQYLIEQLPEVINIVDKHTFQYCHRPYVDPDNKDLPAIINAKGCARTEGFQGRKQFDMFGFLASRHREISMSCNVPEETLRNQGLPLAMRFRGLRDNSTKARERYVVLRSEIHGRGLYARSDVEKGDLIIEYAGEVIRPSLTDLREKYYESRGIGCYMFRINDQQVIDATLKGNAARFINHCCEPNCEAKTVKILGKDHILIFALRKIFKGEELTYDYKFEREEKKILCTCGAARCRKYMN